MHDNRELVNRLYTALDAHDHQAMAECYAPDAHFRDIAFDLAGRERIHAMWRMICSGDIRASFTIIQADERAGRVALVDSYTFGASRDPARPGRRVRNEIISRFTFGDGLIISHEDECDARAWATAALGSGVAGFLAGHIRWIRSCKARQKLAAFEKRHPVRA
jgi:ketosteroid isomerase-like protein